VHRIRPFLDLLRDTTMERLVRLSLRPVLLVRDPADHGYRNILIPVSFSPSCAAAVRISKLMAPDAALRLFHAVSIPFSGLTMEGPGSATAKTLCTEAKAEAEIWRLANDFDESAPHAEIITGYRTEIMMRLLAEHPDVIAVGAHTRSGINPYGLGSFVAELIRNPPCDLLVARSRPHP
jgi:nucleotide-binding universal stress UspA family protein